MSIVSFHNADRIIKTGYNKSIREFIVQVFKDEFVELQRLNYIFCSDAYLLSINKAYLNHDYLTDIITFDLSENGGVIGEVYISLDRVKENAGIFSSSYHRELLRVIIHGALHLCGYKDKTKSEITKMREKEEAYLRLFDKNKVVE